MGLMFSFFSCKAQVSSSDAIKNAPFVLVIGSSSGSNVSFKATDEYAKTYPSTTPSAQMGLVKIPKSVVDFVDTGSYQLVEPISHLPMVRKLQVLSFRSFRLSRSWRTHLVVVPSYWRGKLREKKQRYRLPYRFGPSCRIPMT